MNLYGVSPYNLGNIGWQGQQPLYPQQSLQNPLGFPQSQTGYGQQYPSTTGMGLQSGQQGVNVPESFGGMSQLTPEFSGISQRGPMHISPEEFTGALGRTGRITGGLTPLEGIFVSELARSARGLQEVAEQLEGRDPESQRRGHFAATAHVFYLFGLLSSKGIFIPSDLPGRSRSEGIGAATACRELGRVIERIVDKYASGQGIMDELSVLMERGKVCYQEVARGIETVGGTHGAPQEGGEQPRKKAA